jgi:hypothetical protein
MSDAVSGYLLELEARGRSRKTIVSYRTIIPRWLRSGESDPVKFLASINRVGLGSWRHYRGALRLYLDWCVRLGHIKENALQRSTPAREPHPLDAARESFLLELSATGHSRNTVREYGATVRRWQDSGQEPQTHLMGKNLAPSSRTKEGIVLRRFLAWAVVHGHLAENPLAAVRFPRVRRRPRACQRPRAGVSLGSVNVRLKSVDGSADPLTNAASPRRVTYWNSPWCSCGDARFFIAPTRCHPRVHFAGVRSCPG